MRQLVLSPRWIMWHVLTLGGMIVCGLLAAWQWQRAGSSMGSALNVGYGLQWPVFAVFFGVMWWRMLRMEAARLAAPPESGAPGAENAEPRDSRAADSGAADSGAADSRAAGPRARDAGPSGVGRPEPVSVAAGAAGAGRPRSGPADVSGPSPFTARPATVAAPVVTVADDPELAAYNRMLAQLADRSDH